MQMKKIKAVALDWDGVLCDSFKIYTAHLNTTLTRYGKPQITLDDNRSKTSGPSVTETLRRCGIEEHDLEEARRVFLELARSGPEPPIFPDTHDTLRWLYDRSIMVFIVSAHPEEDIRRFIESYGLSGFVTGLRGGAGPTEKVSFMKTLLAERKIAPEEIILVDDMDVIMALAEDIGCWRIASARGFCSPKRLRLANPHKIARTLKSLQGFINLINHDKLNRLHPNPSKAQSAK